MLLLAPVGVLLLKFSGWLGSNTLQNSLIWILLELSIVLLFGLMFSLVRYSLQTGLTISNVLMRFKFFLLLVWLLIAVTTSAQSLYAFLDPNTDLFGYKLKNGTTVIPPQFHVVAHQQWKHVAFVASDSGWISIDSKNRFLFRAFTVDNAPDEFSNGLCRIIVNGKVGYINKKGRVVITPKFACAEPFVGGKAKVAFECATKRVNEVTTQHSSHWFEIEKQGRFTQLNLLYTANDVESITYTSYYVHIDELSLNHQTDTIDNGEWSSPMYQWLEKIWKQTKAGKIVVYANKECSIPLTHEQVNKLLVKSYTFKSHDSTTFNITEQTLDIETHAENISLLKCYERWVTISNGKWHKQLISFAPVLELKDNTAEYPFLKNELFWIKQ